MTQRTRPLTLAPQLLAVATLAFLFTACADTPVAPDVEAAAMSTENTLTGDDLHGNSDVFPSSNEVNEGNGWSHVIFVDVGVENVTLEFNQPRWFAACFEYRIDDGDPVDPTGNFNPDVDELWNFHCLGDAYDRHTLTDTFQATSHVDIRLAFGAESDERFDWTRFYVLSLENKDACKDGEWQELGFRNQGQCVRYVETGKDSR